MIKKGKHWGVNTNRLKNNPEENRFAQAWKTENDQGKLLDYLLDPAFKGMMPGPSTEREAQVAATAIQWLGTPVGRSFLRDLGYIQAEELLVQLEASIPYVVATIDPRGGNTIKGTEKDWVGVHAGRAGSSVNQLRRILRTVQGMKP